MELESVPREPHDGALGEPELFASLAESPPERRAERLADLRGRDGALARRMEALLGFHESDLLPEPPESSPGILLRDEPADPLVGLRLGRFELVRIVGRGGMGIVYEARQAAPARRVAVKILGGLQAS